ncbi:MAG: hypothetical protein PHZ04_00370 [Patescibacteria group bacterium]|nr:hypothetical protein [Patescibacteria group bacterium]MDD5295059.1 hypothetical protein [Patescibacteria group bacterium]MDD5555033.1 hypothetical protein [Patescibacteria group bacterium]
MMKNHILNLRPYSWIDLILLGFLAKFSITKTLEFSFSDFYFIIGLFFLWFFFNFSLEAKHNYSYRGKSPLYLPIIIILISIIFSFLYNSPSLIPLFISVLFILFYLQKNKGQLSGNLSIFARGIIQSSFFLYAVLLLSDIVNNEQTIITFLIFVLYIVRSLIADIRDVNHNREANKRTFPVNYGINACKILVIFLLLTATLIQIFTFESYLISLPLILFAITLIFYSNGYVLHQLLILTTSFFSLNLISYFTNQSLVFMNIIFLGILLNFIFYPLLKRKSNPRFVNE